MDCSFQSPAPFREQRAYRGEYSVSWKPHFYCMAGDWFGETAWGSLKKVSFIEESFFEKSFLYKGNNLWFFFLYKGKCCIFAPRLT